MSPSTAPKRPADGNTESLRKTQPIPCILMTCDGSSQGHGWVRKSGITVCDSCGVEHDPKIHGRNPFRRAGK